MKLITFTKITVSLITLGLLGACAAPTFKMPVAEPKLSSIKYEAATEQSKNITITDSRDATSSFSEGLLKFNIQYKENDINEIEFLSAALKKELMSRGIPVDFSKDGEQSAQLDVNTFKIFNHRVNAFSPLVTFTQFSGDFTVNGETKRLVSFVKRGKVPIWTITEDAIKENTFNQPISLVIQDIATRINQNLNNLKLSDDAIEALSLEITNGNFEDPTHYMKVYQLGFGNNTNAIPHLLKFTSSTDEYVRLAAISSLGLLHAESEVDTLINIFKTNKLWQDRGMALKALADINTSESAKIVEDEWQRVSQPDATDKESVWNKAILSLYR